MPKVGFRFRPTEQELVDYFLYNKITKNPVLNDDDDAVKVCDLYGDQEPWDIWNFYGGNDLLEDEELYFFTQLKKRTPNGSRYIRKIGSGVWQAEDGAREVKASGGSKQILGFKRRFRYENGDNSEQNGGWIMHQFTINPLLLGSRYSHNAMDYVLCCVKRKERVQNKENADLGKKQRKCKQIVEKNESIGEETGRKRRLKQAETSNKNDDKWDLNKPLKAERGAILVPQNRPIELPCANNVLKVLEFEAWTETERNFNTFHVEDLFSSNIQSGEVDCTQYQISEGFECVQNQHLMGEQGGGEEEEALQVVEYEAEAEPQLDFEESFSSMDDNFDLILTSTDLEFLKQ